MNGQTQKNLKKQNYIHGTNKEMDTLMSEQQNIYLEEEAQLLLRNSQLYLLIYSFKQKPVLMPFYARLPYNHYAA